MKPLIKAGLPGIHIAWNLPLVVRHGPISSQGLQILDLWILQGIHKLWAYLRHGDQMTTITGSLIRASFEQATLEIGINDLLTHSYRRYGRLLTPCHLASLWSFLDQSQELTLYSRCPYVSGHCQGNLLLMEFFSSHPSVSLSDLTAINSCRQWLQALLVMVFLFWTPTGMDQLRFFVIKPLAGPKKPSVPLLLTGESGVNV